MNWIVELTGGGQTVAQCDAMGVSPDGSLLAFTVPQVMGQAQQPTCIMGYAPGTWHKFYQSSLRSN